MSELEHIAPIASRALKDLEKSWGEGKEEEIENTSQGDLVNANAD